MRRKFSRKRRPCTESVNFHMAHFLSKERDADVMEAYRRYQQYLNERRQDFPPSAFKLATAEWYYDPSDHRCPHDGWLESVDIAEVAAADKQPRIVTLRVRLLAAYHDGYIEFFYPRVFSYLMDGYSCANGSGDWCCDEFRLSPSGNVIHEIEWAAAPGSKGSRWLIESSDVEFRWLPELSSSAH